MRQTLYARSRRSGAAAFGALLWLLALLLLVAPFLRAPDGLGPEGRDDDLRSDLDRPFALDVADWEAEFEPGLAAFIAEAGEEWFGRDSARLADTGLVRRERVAAGERAYRMHCVGCHGVTGDGAGPAALHLSPRPRNFRRGVFKFTSTDTGQRPLRRDLFSVVTRGLAGSSMPEFRLLSEEIRWDLVEYVRYVAMRGEFEQLLLDLAWEDEELPEADEVAEIVYERWGDAVATYPSAAETDADAASIERGREVYFDTAVANCAACHGETGRGDGPSATDFDDGWGYPIAPRDLTTGVFRAGSGPEDLYRSIATGINGTPMGSFSGSLTPEQIWDLVHFVQSLAQEQ